MKDSMYIIAVCSICFLFSCKQKISVHEIVHVDEKNKTSDDVYITYLSDQIDEYPEEGDNYLKLAKIYKRQNSITKSIVLLERANSRNPDNINVLIELASLYLLEENVDELSRSLNRLRRMDPDNMDFLKHSAGYSLLLKDYTNAIFFANRAMLANPHDNDNYFLRGMAQLIHKDSLNALSSFEEAYKLKNSYRNFASVFDVAVAVEDKDKAKWYFDDYNDKVANTFLCYEWGVYVNEFGNSDSARKILKECLEASAEEPRVKFELAKNYFRANEIDSAILYVDQYIQSNPGGTDMYVLKAQALEKRSYYTEAKKLYNYALEIDSTSTLANRGLENLERKVAYLRLVKRKEEVQKQVETLKPLNSKEIN
jgi:tetratricopeptide (TPR) repeat protein